MGYVTNSPEGLSGVTEPSFSTFIVVISNGIVFYFFIMLCYSVSYSYIMEYVI
jgi:hypothetical protein